MRLQINGAGDVRTVASNFTGSWTQFTFTEVENPSTSSVSQGIADLSVYPNEVLDVLNISFNPSESISKIEIMDMYGQTQKSSFISESETKFDVTNLDSGLYLLHFFEGSELIETKRIIKK